MKSKLVFTITGLVGLALAGGVAVWLESGGDAGTDEAAIEAAIEDAIEDASPAQITQRETPQSALQKQLEAARAAGDAKKIAELDQMIVQAEMFAAMAAAAEVERQKTKLPHRSEWRNSVPQLTESQIRKLWSTGNPIDQVHALKSLAILEDKAAASDMAMEIIATGSASFQGRAMEILAQVNPELAASVLPDMLFQDRIPARRKAAHLLAELGVVSAIEPLRQAFEEYPDNRAGQRAKVAKALRDLGDDSFISEMIQIAETDLNSGDPELELEAVESGLVLNEPGLCLGALGSAAAHVRSAAITCVRRIGGQVDLADVQAMSEDSDPEVASDAEKAVTAMMNRFEDMESYRLRQQRLQ